MGYRILRKTAFDFFGNVVFVVLYCVQLFWWSSYKPSEKFWAISPKGNHKLSKTTSSTFQIVFLSSAGLFSSVVTKKSVSRTSSDLCTCNNTSFWSNAESRFGCARLRRLRLVFWLFTSCVWDVVGYRILRKTAFDFFVNVVFVVLYCVQMFWWFSCKPPEKFWAISPKGKHKISKTTLSTFQNCLFELCWACFFGCN